MTIELEKRSEVSESDILKVEEELRVEFSSEYRNFLIEYQDAIPLIDRKSCVILITWETDSPTEHSVDSFISLDQLLRTWKFRDYMRDFYETSLASDLISPDDYYQFERLWPIANLQHGDEGVIYIHSSLDGHLDKVFAFDNNSNALKIADSFDIFLSHFQPVEASA